MGTPGERLGYAWGRLGDAWGRLGRRETPGDVWGRLGMPGGRRETPGDAWGRLGDAGDAWVHSAPFPLLGKASPLARPEN